jgi:putative NIF3 family GTP cyclohydrolase 1 type 2
MTRHISRNEFAVYLGQTNAAQYRDYCPNGLQEGRATIGRVVSGVTASLALIEAAGMAGRCHPGPSWLLLAR